MVYAKKVQGETVIALLTYGFEPVLSKESNIVIISKSEYDLLLEQMTPEDPEQDPDEISDTEALNIILGNEVITDETR